MPAVNSTSPTCTSSPARRTATPGFDTAVGGGRGRRRPARSPRPSRSPSAPSVSARPVMMRIASPAPTGRDGRRTGRDLADDSQFDRHDGEVVGTHRVAVDRTVVERRHLLGRDHVGGQHQPTRLTVDPPRPASSGRQASHTRAWAASSGVMIGTVTWPVRDFPAARLPRRRVHRALAAVAPRRRRNPVPALGERRVDGHRRGRSRGRHVRGPAVGDVAGPPVPVVPRPRRTRPVARHRRQRAVGRTQRCPPPRHRRLRRHPPRLHAVHHDPADPPTQARGGRLGGAHRRPHRRRDARRHAGRARLRADRDTVGGDTSTNPVPSPTSTSTSSASSATCPNGSAATDSAPSAAGGRAGLVEHGRGAQRRRSARNARSGPLSSGSSRPSSIDDVRNPSGLPVS